MTLLEETNQVLRMLARTREMHADNEAFFRRVRETRPAREFADEFLDREAA